MQVSPRPTGCCECQAPPTVSVLQEITGHPETRPTQLRKWSTSRSSQRTYTNNRRVPRSLSPPPCVHHVTRLGTSLRFVGIGFQIQQGQQTLTAPLVYSAITVLVEELGNDERLVHPIAWCVVMVAMSPLHCDCGGRVVGLCWVCGPFLVCRFHFVVVLLCSSQRLP